MRAFRCWPLVHVHVSPQLQTSPHWHDAVAGTGAGFWQPQVHCEPAQDWHAQTFELLDMGRSWFRVDGMSTTSGVSHPAGGAGLDGTANLLERIGYSALVNGEAISANCPRINADGAMPTIW